MLTPYLENLIHKGTARFRTFVCGQSGSNVLPVSENTWIIITGFTYCNFSDPETPITGSQFDAYVARSLHQIRFRSSKSNNHYIVKDDIRRDAGSPGSDTNLIVNGDFASGSDNWTLGTGWTIAAQKHIEIFRNYSSFGMGGVSRPSQIYVTKLLEPNRVQQARSAVCTFFASQRARYEKGLKDLGFELFTGNGGFYHWGKLPGGVNADDFNERLFQHNAGILPGRLCDMARRDGGPLEHFMRFSFGPLGPDSYDEDVEILSKCV